MNLSRWLSVILMTAFFLALNPLGAQADPPCGRHPKYHQPRGNAYGWHGKRHHAYDRHYKHFRGSHHSQHYAHHAGPPVAYVTPVAPMIGIPYSQPQPYYSQPANPGLTGNLNWNF
jgi:hypothetical protein